MMMATRSPQRWLLGLSVLALLVLPSCAGASTPSARSSSSAAPAAISTAQCAADRAAGTITYLSPFSYDASAGIIDIYAAIKRGYFAQLCLTVDFVANPGYGLYTEVSAGKAQVTAEGSAADDLLEIANGANLVGVATYGNVSDYAILTRASITKLTELEGKAFGYHTVTPVVLSETLKAAGVDISKVHFVADNSYDPTLLVHGPFQAIQAYQSNEPLTLRADHDAFNEFTPAQFGVPGTFNVEVMNGAFLAKHAGAAGEFLRAELHAFDYCATAAHAPTCVSYLAKAAGQNFVGTPHALAEWKLEYQLAEEHTLPGAGVGVQSVKEWTPEAKAIVSFKLVKTAPKLSTAEDTTLAASLYHGRTLIWP